MNELRGMKRVERLVQSVSAESRARERSRQNVLRGFLLPLQNPVRCVERVLFNSIHFLVFILGLFLHRKEFYQVAIFNFLIFAAIFTHINFSLFPVAIYLMKNGMHRIQECFKRKDEHWPNF